MKSLILIVSFLSTASIASASRLPSIYSCKTMSEPAIDITILDNYDVNGDWTSTTGILKSESFAVRLDELSHKSENPATEPDFNVTWSGHDFELKAYFPKFDPTLNFKADLKWLGNSYLKLNCEIL